MIINKKSLDLVGTPYEKLNCWALAQRVFKDAGITLPDNPWESIERWEDVPQNAAKEGDMLVFATARRLTTHVGVVVDAYGHFLHSVEGIGVVRDSLLHERWASRLVGVMRWRA